jgi:hypothetical protein
MSEHEMRTVANTLAAVGLSWNPAGRKPADMYRAMADRLADAGLLQSPETAAELKQLRADLEKRVSELEAGPSRAEVLREFAARVEEMREEGEPGDWLSAGTAVEEIIGEAHNLANEATRCVSCHLPETAKGGDES